MPLSLYNPPAYSCCVSIFKSDLKFMRRYHVLVFFLLFFFFFESLGYHSCVHCFLGCWRRRIFCRGRRSPTSALCWKCGTDLLCLKSSWIVVVTSSSDSPRRFHRYTFPVAFNVSSLAAICSVGYSYRGSWIPPVECCPALGLVREVCGCVSVSGCVFYEYGLITVLLKNGTFVQAGRSKFPVFS